MYTYSPNTLNERINAFREKESLHGKAFWNFFFGKDSLYDHVVPSTMWRIEHGEIAATVELLVSFDQKELFTPDQLLFGKSMLPVACLREYVEPLGSDVFDSFLARCREIAEQFPPDSVARPSAQLFDYVELQKKVEAIEQQSSTLSGKEAQVRSLKRQLRENKASDCALRLREIRGDRHMTQTQLAETLGVNHNTICNNELNADLPTLDYLALFCRTLEVSADYILDSYFALPPQLSAIQTLLSDYRYRTQQRLVALFCDATKNFLQK